VDGNREGLIDTQTGFLLQAFDKQKLADALTKLVEDQSMRSRMGAAGREFALKRFDAKVMIDELEKLYNHR
jgi:glycosyltransferase involved in cell wall biosynthesis